MGSGPEILRNIGVIGCSLYNLGHAIETVKIRYDIDEISDAFLPEVVRTVGQKTQVDDYNVLSNFVVVNLAEVLESTPLAVSRACDHWTRGELKRFLKLKMEFKEKVGDELGKENNELEGLDDDLDGEQERGVLDDESIDDFKEEGETDEAPDHRVGDDDNDDDDDTDESNDEKRTMGMEGDPETPWSILKGNVDLLAERGFDKDAILLCLTVLARSRAELKALCDLHVNESSDKIGEMQIEDQKANLNLIVYHAERTKCNSGVADGDSAGENDGGGRAKRDSATDLPS